MKTKILVVAFLGLFIFTNCREKKVYEKGFSANAAYSEDNEDTSNDIQSDSTTFETRPNSILLTGHPKIRLTTVYKVNYNKKTGTSFIGDNEFYWNYYDCADSSQNMWNYHFMPGLEALYGYNLVNISHFDTEKKISKNFFDKPVLIKTFYFPAFLTDILNYKPLKRNYFLISVYDEDTNNDGIINTKDLRRLYYFDLNAENKTLLIPSDYSVFKSEYDSANDYMYVFARQDKNSDGITEAKEPIHIFLIDLANPTSATRFY